MIKKLIKNKKIILYLILLGNFLIFANVLAWELQTSWPPSPTGKRLTSTSTITELVQYFYEWGIGLGGLAAFIALVIAGVLYLTSAGDPAKMKEAKDRIYWALGGLVFLLASWLILNTINPELTTLREPTFNYENLLGVGACNNDTDCQQIEFTGSERKTIKQIIAGKNCKCHGDPNPDDMQKEGSCFCQEEEVPSCEMVKLYRNPGFQGNPEEIEEIIGTGAGGGCVNFTYRPWFTFFLSVWGHRIFKSSQGYYKRGESYLKDGKSYLYELKDSEEKLVKGIELENCLEALTEIDEKTLAEGLKDKQIICKPFHCSGNLQFFADGKCDQMLAQLGPTNSDIPLETKVGSVKFVTLPPETGPIDISPPDLLSP